MSDELTREKLAEYIHEALRAWHRPDAAIEPCQALADGLLLMRQRREDGTSPVDVQQATQALLQKVLAALAEQDEEAAEVLRQRFIEDKTLYGVGHALEMSEHAVSRRQRAGLDAAAALLWRMEHKAREARSRRIEALLPPPTYSRLFGLDDVRATLFERVKPLQPPWVVAVAGIGGIGKTALAHAVTRQLVQELLFEDVHWLRLEAGDEGSAGHYLFERVIDELAERLMGDYVAGTSEQRLVQVRQQLATAPHLVVIDNLEVAQDLDSLVVHLNDLADPSKFLLTTRVRPPQQVAVFTCSLDELQLEDAVALVKHHAQEVGIQFLAQATSKDFADIYATTGGNPLALKLVVGLVDELSLPKILAGLEESKPGPIEDLYVHIYWQSWRTLGEDARRLLKAMPLVAETGATLDYLQALSGLEADQLWPALHELRRRSLLEVRGSLHEKRYGIHRLTDSFLRTEIVHWPEEGTNR